MPNDIDILDVKDWVIVGNGPRRFIGKDSGRILRADEDVEEGARIVESIHLQPVFELIVLQAAGRGPNGSTVLQRQLLVSGVDCAVHSLRMTVQFPTELIELKNIHAEDAREYMLRVQSAVEGMVEDRAKSAGLVLPST